MRLVLPSKLCSCLRHCSGIFHRTKLKTVCTPRSPHTTRFKGSQFSTRKKVHFQFTFKWNFNIRIRVSFQNENHNERILECSLLAEASFPWYSSPGGRGMEILKDVLYGEASPQGPTSYPFIYHFWQKKYPFCMQLNLSEWPPWGQKKVAIVERLKQAQVYGPSSQKNGHCREVAVVERWPIVKVGLYLLFWQNNILMASLSYI